MKKVLNWLARDLWVVLLDLVAVNVSYLLSLYIRFVTNADKFSTLKDLWLKMAPIYSVVCVIVFVVFRLYGGMWRFAGINDMNRIIGANAVTAVAMIVITLVVMSPKRMPVTYYFIGALLQFILVSLIRFGYRILMVEKKKLKQSAKVPALVIGSGELGRKVVKHLEDGGAYQPVAIIGPDAGRQLDGIPVVGFGELKLKLEKARAVFIADRELTAVQRAEIDEAAKGLEVADYTGALSNMTGAVPVTGLLEAISGPVTVSADGVKRMYSSGMDAIADLRARYLVTGIRGQDLVVELVKDDGLAYLRQHQAETGEELSFF